MGIIKESLKNTGLARCVGLLCHNKVCRVVVFLCRGVTARGERPHDSSDQSRIVGASSLVHSSVIVVV